MKKLVLFLVVIVSIGSICDFSYPKDKSINIKKDIIDKIEFPLYGKMVQPDSFSLTLNYAINDQCLDCVVSFFKRELKNKGWQVQEQEVVGPYMDSFLQFKKQLLEAQKKGLSLGNIDPATAEHIMTMDEARIRQKIAMFSPIVIQATHKAKDIKCYLAIKKESKQKINLSLTIQK